MATGTINPAAAFGPGTATANLARLPKWDYTSYFGHQSQGTGPNQAVLGGPTQTPCGWAPFTIISDGKQKIFDGEDTSAIADLMLQVAPKRYRLNPDARYHDREEKEAEIDVEYEEPKLDKGGKPVLGKDGKPVMVKKKRKEKRYWCEDKCHKNDGSRADKHVTLGYDAREIGEAAKKAGVDFPAVFNAKDRGGLDVWMLDSVGMTAALHCLVLKQQEIIQAMKAALEQAGLLKLDGAVATAKAKKKA